MRLRTALIACLLCSASSLVSGEVCSSSTATVSAPVPRSSGGVVPQVLLEPTLPYWLYTPDGGPFELEVRLTLQKDEDDGRPPCVFTGDSRIRATIEITNLSDRPYETFLGSTGRFWEIYLYDARRSILRARFSDGQPYDDDRYIVDLDPGQTLAETRLWLPDGVHGPVIPAGVYRAVGRFEPDNASPPALTRSDPTLAPGLTIAFVE